MDTKQISRWLPCTFVAVVVAAAQPNPEQVPLQRLNRMTDSEQVELAKSLLKGALPYGAAADTLYSLAVGRSSLILPIIEAKIEELLRESGNSEQTTGKGAQDAILYLGKTIAAAGDYQALQQASELLKIDEKRFDRMVAHAMYAAFNRGNPFTVAYQGLELGDTAIDKRLMEWAEDLLEKDLPHLCDPLFDGVERSPRRLWADALVKRNGHPPTATQWLNDPIARRLKPSLTVVYQDVARFAAEAAEKRVRNQ